MNAANDKGVDALAVLDATVRECKHDAEAYAEAKTVRDAVAELIEKAAKLAANDFTFHPGTAYSDAVALRAALARVQGGAA